MTTSYLESLTVQVALGLDVRIMCPLSGDQRSLSDGRLFEGTTKEQMLTYGTDWLAVYAADVPNGWMVKIGVMATFTSEQAPQLREVDEGPAPRWLPKTQAFAEAQQAIERFARFKTWGGGSR